MMSRNHCNTVGMRQEGPGFESTGRLLALLVEFVDFPSACIGSLQALPELPPTVQSNAIRYTGDPKLAINVTVRRLSASL